MIPNDTICAISTPSGVGGIAVVRISGRDAIPIADKIWRGKRLNTVHTHTAHYGTIYDPDTGEELDQAVATVFHAPKSFTGEDVVEISVHGSRWIQQELLALLIRTGCRIAEAGEFTRRAFTSGKMDLAEAEAVADIIASSSRASHKVAMSQMRGDLSRQLNDLHDRLLDLVSLMELELDFSEEDVEFASRDSMASLTQNIYDVVSRMASSFATGQAIKDGIPVTIAGETNVGKSTLLNTLLHEQRAIVSDIHGTTRDAIEDTVEIDGILFRITDTAGLRQTDDPIESLGIELTHSKIRTAQILLWIIDANSPIQTISERWDEIKRSYTCSHDINGQIIVVINKIDTVCATDIETLTIAIRDVIAPDCPILPISAKTGKGIQQLETVMVNVSGAHTATEDMVIITNARHYAALTAAKESCSRALVAMTNQIPSDLISQDIRETLHHLATITGAITTDDVLSTIFSRFCIGK